MKLYSQILQCECPKDKDHGVMIPVKKAEVDTVCLLRIQISSVVPKTYFMAIPPPPPSEV